MPEAVAEKYLTDFRIQNPVHLLRETSLSIAAIAYSVDLKIICIFPKHLKADAYEPVGLPGSFRRENLPKALI